MNIAAFDQWRAEYDTLTYQEQVKFYNQVEKDHPVQNSFRNNLPAWLSFFAYVAGRLGKPRVMELGGWHGELASIILSSYPVIDSWTNYEISQEAVNKTVCGDSRYQAIVPNDYAWNIKLPDCDVFVASHTLEHIRARKLERLLDNLPATINYLAIEIPLPESGPVDWGGYHGSHILELNWAEVEALLILRGFQPIRSLCWNEFRAFERKSLPIRKDSVKAASRPGTVGVAMIARNGAELMPTALDPFAGKVDEIAIVLGGVSTDSTVEVAAGYTDKVATYPGPLDPDGRLMHFGAARQQSFDLLSTDWAIVVDCDDNWTGVENLANVIQTAEDNGARVVYVPYELMNGDNTSTFSQARIFRRDSGRWDGAIHETWTATGQLKPIATIDMSIKQIKQGPDGRLEQNIAIIEAELESGNGNSKRLLAHLAQDYAVSGRLEEALEATDKYLEFVEGDTEPRHPDEYFYVAYLRGVTLMHLGKFPEAMRAALIALSAGNFGRGWALFAEAAYHLSQRSPTPIPLSELVIFCADQALRRGKDRSFFPADLAATTTAPAIIKAKALISQGRVSEALAAVDLALAIDPEEQEAKQMQNELAAALNRLP